MGRTSRALSLVEFARPVGARNREPRPLDEGLAEEGGGFEAPVDQTPSPQVVLVLEGEAVLEVNGNHCVLAAGNCRVVFTFDASESCSRNSDPSRSFRRA